MEPNIRVALLHRAHAALHAITEQDRRTAAGIENDLWLALIGTQDALDRLDPGWSDRMTDDARPGSAKVVNALRSLDEARTDTQKRSFIDRIYPPGSVSRELVEILLDGKPRTS